MPSRSQYRGGAPKRRAALRRSARGQPSKSARSCIRLSRTRASDAPVLLSLGERRFRLAAGEGDAWAADARMDAAIVAAMRSATSMSVSSVGRDGRPFADTYALRGAATAIDAAALGCVRRR